MKKTIFKIVIVLLLISGMTGVGYLWHVKTQLDAEILSLNHDLDASERRNRVALKKLSQEKAKLNTCMRAKMAAESQKAHYQKRLKTAEKAVSELEKDKVLLTELLEKKFSCDQTIAKWKEAYQKLEDRRKEGLEKYAAALQVIREKKEEIELLDAEKQELTAALNQTESRLDRSLKHNEKLCAIAEELTMKFKEETHGKSEPFTKIKMVELEHLIQDYIQKIDKEEIIE